MMFRGVLMITKKDTPQIATVDSSTVDCGAPIGLYLTPLKVIRWVTDGVVEVETLAGKRRTTWIHACFLVDFTPYVDNADGSTARLIASRVRLSGSTLKRRSDPA